MTVLALSVVFTSEPRDVCVAEGMEAFFPCTYNGTSAQSFWRINEMIRSSARLPLKHRLNRTGLVVNADSTLNMSTYSCSLQIPTSDGVELLESNTAMLKVVSHMASLGNDIIIVNHSKILISWPLLCIQPVSQLKLHQLQL